MPDLTTSINEKEALPKDNDTRSASVDITRSFIVSAPAGSGKTGLLTLRVLKLLAAVNRPEEILCITFTRKAANEMQERILSALQSARDIGKNSQSIHEQSHFRAQILNAALLALKNADEKIWMLLETPFRLKILTIDGFCKSLCVQLPFFSGLGSSTHIAEHPETEYAAAINTWLADKLYNEDNPHLQILIRHLSGNLTRLQQLFSSLLSTREQWSPLLLHSRNRSYDIRSYFEKVLRGWIKEEIDHCLTYLIPYESEICDLIAYAFNNSKNEKNTEQMALLSEYMHFPDYQPGVESYWRAFADFILTRENTWRKRLTKANGFPSAGNSEEKKLCKLKKEQFFRIFSEAAESGLEGSRLGNLKSLPDASYSDSQWTVLEALFELLPELLAFLKLQFSDNSVADFTEFSLGAAQALSEINGHIDLQQRLDYSIHHILIDEFQDTSQLQLELLQSLIREWIPGDGRTLFLVGDGMQSCYSFRNANVGIFLNLRKYGFENIALHPIDLGVNFRSTETIISWVNAVFSSSFPKNNDANLGAVAYIPSDAYGFDSEDSVVGVHGFENDLDNQDEEYFILNEIQNIRSNNPDETIAVLVRNKSHLQSIIALFNKNKIPFQAVEIDALLSKQYCTDALTLVKLLSDPYDKLAWLAFLRLPCCALTHSDLFYFFQTESVVTNQDDNIETLEKKKTQSTLELLQNAVVDTRISEGSRKRLQTVSRYLIPTIKSRKSRPLHEQLENLWLQLGLSCQLESDNAFNDIERLIQCVAHNERTNEILDWPQFERALEKLFAEPMTSSNNPIQCMTMHKSKGLEFDHVFCPKLHKSSHARDDHILYWLERLNQQQIDFILSPVAASNSVETDLMTQFIKRQSAAKSDFEDCRIFYVACTRARKRLYLSFRFNRSAQGEIGQPAKNSLMHKIWAQVADKIVEHTPVNAKSNTTDTNGLLFNTMPHIRGLKNNWQTLVAPPAYLIAQDSSHTNQEYDNTYIDLRAIWRKDTCPAIHGTVFHRILKQLCEQGLTTFNTKKIAYLRPIWSTQLQQLGETDPLMIKATLDKFAKQITVFQANSQAKWILDHQHVHSACELRILSTKSDGNHEEFCIDRTFVEQTESGPCRWIIDYKTGAPDENSTIEAFLQQQRSHHKAQLSNYISLMQSFDRQKKWQVSHYKSALYFPLLCLLEVF